MRSIAKTYKVLPQYAVVQYVSEDDEPGKYLLCGPFGERALPLKFQCREAFDVDSDLHKIAVEWCEKELDAMREDFCNRAADESRFSAMGG